MKQNRCMPHFPSKRTPGRDLPPLWGAEYRRAQIEKKKNKLMVSGADRSEPLLGFYFEGRHRAKGWDHVWERCLNTGRCCDVWAPQLLLLLAPFAAFMAILGHYKELKKKKKELVAVGLPRVRQEEGDVSFLELAGQCFVCCVGCEDWG